MTSLITCIGITTGSMDIAQVFLEKSRNLIRNGEWPPAYGMH